MYESRPTRLLILLGALVAASIASKCDTSRLAVGHGRASLENLLIMVKGLNFINVHYSVVSIEERGLKLERAMLIGPW